MLDKLDLLTKDELKDLVRIYAKNMYALDGVWFQSVEKENGMDRAMWHDGEAWKKFTGTEAKRIKKLLHLPERAGLEGLKEALALRFSALANPSVDIFWEGKSLIYRINECRVQSARKKKGMPFHPCAPVGFIEHDGFARVIDERIVTEKISCYPEVTDPACACCWKFTLKEAEPVGTI